MYAGEVPQPATMTRSALRPSHLVLVAALLAIAWLVPVEAGCQTFSGCRYIVPQANWKNPGWYKEISSKANGSGACCNACRANSKCKHWSFETYAQMHNHGAGDISYTNTYSCVLMDNGVQKTCGMDGGPWPSRTGYVIGIP